MGEVIRFPRVPRRRVVIRPDGAHWWRALVVLADNRPSPRFPVSRPFDSAALAYIAAENAHRLIGLPLEPWTDPLAPDGFDGPGMAA